MSRALVELINIRISQINGCAYCLDTHVSAALRYGEDAQRIAVLPAWRDTTLFTAKERAALTLAESVTTLPDARTQEQDYTDAREHLTADELAAASWIAITMNAFNRISIVSRHAVRPDAEPTPSTERAHLMSVTVRDNPTESRYDIHADDELAGFTAYELTGDEITFTHTETFPAFAGKGLAKQLVTETLDDVRHRGLVVLPVCPYVRKFISRNTATYLDLVPEGERKRYGLVPATT